MNSIQQTVYAIKSLIYSMAGVEPEIDEKSTVNESLDIMGSARPTLDERVKFGVLIAGNGGISCTQGNPARPNIRPRNHLATDANVFTPLPFAIRPVDDDLGATERGQYCLRKEISLPEGNMYAYYGLRIPIHKDNLQVNLVKVTKEDGTIIETPFVPDDSNLKPTPVDLPTENAIIASDVSIRISALMRVTLNARVVGEMVEAAKLLYDGDETAALISELGLCTGADRIISTPSSDGQIQFTESVGTQVYTFATDLLSLYYNKKEYVIDFDIGNQIPLLSKESIPTLTTIP